MDMTGVYACLFEAVCDVTTVPSHLKCNLGLEKARLLIDHLHNYGPGMRFGASPAGTDCDVCVSHLRFRFSSALELFFWRYTTPRFSSSLSDE